MSTEGWNAASKSALVSIGTHKLFLSASGPDRKPGEPIILLMTGHGSTITEWVGVRRLVTPFARWLEYDRSGLGRSGSPAQAPEAIHAVDIARELDTLLKNADVEPPFIIVCHSWGGITSREFLHLRGNEIAGMVFVDANMEKTFQGYEWPMDYILAVNGTLDWADTTGLATDQKLSVQEQEEVVKSQEGPRHQATELLEQKGYRGDGAVLAKKMQLESCTLGERPIAVLQANTARDFGRMFEAGVKAGNGTQKERGLYEAFIKDFETKDADNNQAILRLSRSHRFVRTLENGHNVQMTAPDLVAKEVRWVWDEVMKRSS